MTSELTEVLDRVLEFEADPRPEVLAAALAEARLRTDDEGAAWLLLGDLLLAVHSERDTPEGGTSLYQAALPAAVEAIFDQGDPEQSLAVPFEIGDLSAFPLLAEATAAAREALRRIPGSVAAKALLGTALYEQYEVTADVGALRQAFESWAEVVDAQPEVGLHRVWFARTLITLDAWDDNPHHLASAINVLAELIGSLDDADPDRAVPMLLAAEGMAARYQRTFEPKALDDALMVLAEAVELVGQDHPLSARTANLFGRLLVLRHQLRSDRPDLLRAAVACHYDAIEADPSARHLAALEEATRLGSLLDNDEMWLAEAIMAGERAVTTARPGDAERHAIMLAFGRALHAISEQDVDAEDTASLSVAFLRLALGCLPTAHPRRHAYTAALAEAWMRKFDVTDSTADLAGALEATSQCLRLVGADHPDRPEHLARYGAGLLVGYRQTNDLSYLERAFTTTHRALEAVPEKHPTHSRLLMMLGETTLAYAEATDDEESRLGAARMFQRAARSETALPPVKAAAALRWAGLMRQAQEWAELSLAYTIAIIALQAMTSVEVSRMGQESRLAEFAGVASNAAACMLRTDDADTAVFALETGRGVLFARQLRLTTAASTDLTDQVRLRDEATGHLHEIDEDETDEFPTQRALDVVRRFRRATNKISWLVRDHERPVTPDAVDVIAQSHAGAIVYLNISEHRSDALIVRPEGISVVPLPRQECAPEVVEAKARMLADAGQGSTGMLTLRRVVPEIMTWLWTAVAAPVLEVLDPPSPGEPLPRVWWVPTGHLSLLPVHAAGVPGGPSLLDHVVSSYTPTVQALAHARRPGSTTPSQTIVSLSRTPGQSDLPHAASEADALHRLRPASSPLADENATADRVLASLRTTTWAHFACHATTNVAEPSRSGLLLYDDLLPVTEITGLGLADAELAYLSACTTARSGWDHPDESIHPAGAFQLAGYRHVIATLWPLYDSLAAQAAGAFYDRIGAAPTAARAATALHAVMADLRARYPDRPDIWACLTHYGA